MARTNGRAQTPGLSAADSYARWRRYETVRLDPPYEDAEITFYANPSPAERAALPTATNDVALPWMMQSWNLTATEGGDVLPINGETWRRLPEGMTTRILAKWLEVTAQAANLPPAATSPATTGTPPSPTSAAPAD